MDDTEPIVTWTRSQAKQGSLKATFVRAFAFLSATTMATIMSHATRQRQRVAPPPPTPRVPPPQPHSWPVLAVSPARGSSRQYPKALLLHLAYPVTNEETGKALEYRHLKWNPTLASTWQYSYSNTMGCLCQGVGRGTKGPKKQRIACTDTFCVIRYTDIPCDRQTEIAHVKVVCEVRPQKIDPNRTRITVAGNRILYPGDVGTPSACLDFVKLMLNSVLSRPGARFACFNAANFNLQTQEMNRKEYVSIKFDNIPDELCDEYGLTPDSPLVHHGWVYFAVVRGTYGIPQSGRLANDLLRKRLTASGYHEAVTTPGLWRHVLCPVQFVLIVDNFGVDYVDRKHSDHLLGVLNQHYEMS